jgi:hypothetical protein
MASSLEESCEGGSIQTEEDLPSTEQLPETSSVKDPIEQREDHTMALSDPSCTVVAAEEAHDDLPSTDPLSETSNVKDPIEQGEDHRTEFSDPSSTVVAAEAAQDDLPSTEQLSETSSVKDAIQQEEDQTTGFSDPISAVVAAEAAHDSEGQNDLTVELNHLESHAATSSTTGSINGRKNRRTSMPMMQMSPNPQTTFISTSSGTTLRKRWSHMGGEIPPLFRDIALVSTSYQRDSLRSIPPSPSSPRPNAVNVDSRRWSDSQLYPPALDIPTSSPNSTKTKVIPSKLHATWPPVRPPKEDSVILSLQRAQGMVPPQSVKSRRTSFEPVVRVHDMTVVHDAIRAVGKLKLEAFRNKKKRGRRRPNMRIRWGGPTVFLIDRIRDRCQEMGVEFDPTLLAEDRFVTSLGRDSRPVRPTRQLSLESSLEDGGWYNDQNEEKAHGRPDVWVTPLVTSRPSSNAMRGSADPVNRSWRVKRIWNDADFDQKETEYTVEDKDLMDKVKSLLGVTETEEDSSMQGKWVFDAGKRTELADVDASAWGVEQGGSNLTPIAPAASTGEGERGAKPTFEAADENAALLWAEDDPKYWGASWIYDIAGVIEDSESSDDWVDEGDMLKGLQSIMDEEHSIAEKSMCSIPEMGSNGEILSPKHKSRAFERPDDWVSPADGDRKYVARRSWKIKAVDLTKDSEHSVLTDVTVETTEGDDPTYEDKTEGVEDAEEDDLTPVVAIPSRKVDVLPCEDMTEGAEEDDAEDERTPAVAPPADGQVLSPEPPKSIKAITRPATVSGSTPDASRRKQQFGNIADLLNPPPWKMMLFEDHWED